MESKARKKSIPYPPEFKAGAVPLVLEEGRVAEPVCREVSLASSTLSEWLRQARVGAGQGSSGVLSTEEKQELVRLRREVCPFHMEREILKKATAFFARESR